MADKPIHDMSISQLVTLIQLKEKEYKEAIKARKVFWEVKQIFEQRKKLQSQLLKSTRDHQTGSVL